MAQWVDILRKIAAMEVDTYLGGHGDVGTRADVLQEATMLEDFDRGMRDAVARGLSREDIVRTVKFEQYTDVRNYYRMNHFIGSYYHLLTTGRAENAYP